MSDKQQAQQLLLKNVRVKYAKLIRPEQAYDEGQPDQWTVNMYVTDEDMDTLLALGAKAKEDRENVSFFVAKRAVKSKKGADVKPPQLVNARKEPFTEEVGNGSVCNIVVSPFPWKKGNRSGVLLYLKAVQVVNHVPPSGGADAFEVVGDGAEEHVDDPFV